MAWLDKTRNGKCHTCNRETTWRITHAYHGHRKIIHCYECESCGMLVPDFSWAGYQRDGNVVIPI